jgi:hypothetical protein
MSVNHNSVYTKNGVTFADGAAAKADKNSLYSAELTQAVTDCYATMLTDGILLEPVSYVWDQSTFTLTVTKLVTSAEAYQAAVTFDSSACIADSAAAGWAFVS